MTDNIGAYMQQVATTYWGEPTAKRGHELRWGTHGSKSVDLRKGTWYDFETNGGEGGGVIDLVKREEGATLGGIGSVLQRKFGISSQQVEKLRPREFLSKAYSYYDENGELRYQVLRFEPRRFQQRQPAGESWVYNMDGIEPLPYRLPDIIKNPEAPIFIVEGEKCADTLARHGLVATTSHGGAGKWRDPLNKFFEGRRVIVLPDNDEPGKRHADVVIQKLWGVAAEIKRVELQGLPPKGDVVDWFNSGRDLSAFKQAVKVSPKIEKAPEIISQENGKDFSEANGVLSQQNDETPLAGEGLQGPKSDFPDLFPILSLSDLMALPPVDWAVENLLTRQGLGILYAPPGVGKTFFALDLALSIARGVPFHGLPTTQGRVLYIAGEGAAGLGKRVKALRYARGWREDAPLYILPASVAFANDGDIERLLRTIDAIGENFSLVVVDTVARALLGHEENSADSMGLFIAACDAIKTHTGGALLGIHHAGKDSARGMRGSSALLGGSDSVLKLSQEYGLLTCEIEKQKDAEQIEPLRFRMVQRALIGESSIVLERVEVEGKAKIRLTPSQYHALRILTNTIIDAQAQKVLSTVWHDAHKRDAPDETAQARSAARNALQKRGLVVTDKGFVWPTPEGKEAQKEGG